MSWANPTPGTSCSGEECEAPGLQGFVLGGERGKHGVVGPVNRYLRVDVGFRALNPMPRKNPLSLEPFPDLRSPS